LVLWAALAPDQGAVNVPAIAELSNIIGRLRAFKREEALETRVFISQKVLDTLDQCFKLIGEQPLKPTGRLPQAVYTGHEGATDAGAVCQAVGKDEQERLH
jgi:hypothetical protein